MAEVLSESEIDGLLSAINSGEVAPSGGCTDPRKIKIYDFRRPDKFSKEQIRSVQIVHETFARLATTTLSAAMRSLAHVHVASVDQLTYEEFIKSIPSPTTLAVFCMDPLKGLAVIEIDPAISFAMVELLFGGAADGSGCHPHGVNREITDIEQAVIEGIVVRLLGNLRDSWSQIIDLKPRLAQIETNPQFAQIVPPSEMVILVTLETKVGDSQGMINLCFPYITIEPIISKLSVQYWYSSIKRGSSGEAAGALLAHIEGIDVPVELVAEAERLSLRELGVLRKGSLVRVPGVDRGEASFRMGGRALFRMRALPRKRGEARAYEIVDKPRAETIAQLEPVVDGGEAAGMEAAFKAALADFQAGLGSSLSGIASGISALMQRQNEMTDQLALAPADRGEVAEPAQMRGLVRPFDFVSRSDPSHVLNLISQEHPQTIALVLSYLEAQHASILLGALPPSLQSDVARRIACMGPTQPGVIREVERVIERKLASMSSEDYLVAGGVDGIVQILNLANRSTERHVIESLEEEDPTLAEEIKKRMFVFEDIVLLDRAAIAKVVKRSDGEVFLRAMKAVADKVKDLIWACLPKEDSERLKKRLDDMGKLRLSDVDAAQQAIVALIRELEESGEIVVARPNETVG